jgi:hypothetical protein
MTLGRLEASILIRDVGEVDASRRHMVRMRATADTTRRRPSHRALSTGAKRAEAEARCPPESGAEARLVAP